MHVKTMLSLFLRPAAISRFNASLGKNEDGKEFSADHRLQLITEALGNGAVDTDLKASYRYVSVQSPFE